MLARMSFPAEVSGSPVIDIPPSRWIFEQLEGWVKRSPERVAFVLDHQEKTEEYRYADVLKQAGRIAAGLAERGIGHGDRAGILMENIPQWVFALLGTMRIGAVTVPLATTLPENSIRLIAEHAGCKVIFADEANWEKGQAVAQGLGCLLESLDQRHPTVTPVSRKGSDPEFPCPQDNNDTAILIYTSGTTGNPKGVELTLSNLTHEIRGAVEALRLSPDHRILSILPFSHVLPLIANGLGPLCIGATVVFLSSISPQRIIDAFHRHRITFFICVPQFFYILHKRIFSQVASQPLPMRLAFGLMKRLARHMNPAVRRKFFAKVHLAIGPDLQLLASGGSHFDRAVAQDLSDLGYTVLQAYGLTETSAAATITPVDDNRVGTAGKAIRGVTIRIDSPNGDGIGEVLVRGPVVMKGYYKAPEQTADAIKDGWFHTGDLGFIDADGHLTITGRSKDVIVLANGENVYPEELETHYSKSPFIKEICILGISENGGTAGGGILHAIVVPDMDEFRRRGQTAIMEMIRFEIENLSKQVPSYYRIHSLAVRNEPLPRTVTRKLKRFEIQKQEDEQKKVKSESGAPPPAKDHARFQGRIGSVIAELVREARTDIGSLDPSMSIELDLGFDSLARVELIGLAEARLGAHIDEQQVARIFSLGELIDAFEAASGSGSEVSAGKSWKEILEVVPGDELHQHYIFGRRLLLNPATFVVMRTLKFLAHRVFHMRVYGLEKLPRTMPFLLCPNHESFLDGPLLVSTLPRHVMYNMFILGYSDYWESAVSRRIAQACNIVAIDPNVNLIRAMQVGAVGLKHGRSLLIFPEGTRSIDGHVAPFKKGAAILSYELNVPIVPVGIRGTFEAWPRGGGFRFHPVELHIGEPIDPRSFGASEDPYGAITERLEKDVKALCGDG